jgi:hypothetical protein
MCRIVPASAFLASALLVLCSAIAIAAPPASQTESSKPRYYPKYREGEVLVRLRDHANVDEERRLRERHGLTLIQDLRTIRVRRYRVTPGRSVDDAVERLGKDRSVEFAQPNNVYWILGCRRIRSSSTSAQIRTSGDCLRAAFPICGETVTPALAR